MPVKKEVQVKKSIPFQDKHGNTISRKAHVRKLNSWEALVREKMLEGNKERVREKAKQLVWTPAEFTTSNADISEEDDRLHLWEKEGKNVGVFAQHGKMGGSKTGIGNVCVSIPKAEQYIMFGKGHDLTQNEAMKKGLKIAKKYMKDN